jgi:spore coat protein U-like protein
MRSRARLWVHLTQLTLAACALLGASCAQAATCSVSATPVPFGTYDPLSASPNDSSGEITVSCTGVLEIVAYTVNLSMGNSTNYTGRFLKSGANQLNYNLYTMSTRQVSQIWGDNTGSSIHQHGGFTFVIIVTPTTQTEKYTVFGRIPAGQDVAPGTYSDSITVSVIY